MRTLQTWFRDLDQNKSGQVTQRQFIVSLRARAELMKVFSDCLSHANDEQVEAREVKTPVTGGSQEQAAEKARADMHRMKEILKDIDTDMSGAMDWEEFVDFFRRSGLLLEYKSQEAVHMNRVTLCVELEEAKKVAEEAQAQKDLKSSVARKTAFQSGMAGGGFRELLKKQTQDLGHLFDSDDEE
jgi:hypothetical protein